MSLRPIALVIAPFKTATREEKAATLDACYALLDKGYLPIFLPWALGELLDDHDPEERALALECSRAFVKRIARDRDTQAFVVGERLTEGMVRDIGDWIDVRGQRPLKAPA